MLESQNIGTRSLFRVSVRLIYNLTKSKILIPDLNDTRPIRSPAPDSSADGSGSASPPQRHADYIS